MKLLKAHQEFLGAKVRETVWCEASKKKLDAAKQEAIDKVEEWLRSFSKAEIAAFKKIRIMTPVRYIRVQSDRTIQATRVDYHGIVPLTREDSDDAKVIRDSALAEKLKAANDTFHENTRELCQKYYSIINSCSTWEDLIKLWPEAKKFQPTPNTALVVADPQVIASIRADSKKRKW